MTGVRRGDLVVARGRTACATTAAGLTTSCEHGGFWGSVGYDGGAGGEAVRVQHADGTLVQLPADAASDDLLSALLTLSDVMGTRPPRGPRRGRAPGLDRRRRGRRRG
ncbi:hypothetical protein [Streptomyces sp. KL116D]|uniref:hypothetical protein n=1 Tax=Streptomyces sp. KL116D TaxID=3045152 RepID=UPI003558202C